MVKVLELADIDSGRVCRPAYQSEVFGWLQHPDTQPAPQLELGHRAVLRAAFGGVHLDTIANKIYGLEYSEDRLGAMMVVAGIDYATVEASGITPELATSLEQIGAEPRAHKYAQNLGQLGIQYGFADVFNRDNYRANEALAWLERSTTAEPTALNPFAQNRLATITKRHDFRDARLVVDRLKHERARLARLLLSGFRSPVLLADYDQIKIQEAAGAIKNSIYKRHAMSAARDTARILDFDATAINLATLADRPSWGDDVACTPEDDLLLEVGHGKATVDPRARKLCGNCAVRLYCLDNALEDSSSVIRGGLGPSERLRLYRHIHPDEPEDAEDPDEIAS